MLDSPHKDQPNLWRKFIDHNRYSKVINTKTTDDDRESYLPETTHAQTWS